MRWIEFYLVASLGVCVPFPFLRAWFLEHCQHRIVSWLRLFVDGNVAHWNYGAVGSRSLDEFWSDAARQNVVVIEDARDVFHRACFVLVEN